MKINIYSFFPFLSSLFLFSLGLFAYTKQSSSPINRAFSRFSFISFVWLFSYAISYSITLEQTAFFWLNIGFTAVILIPTAFFHFTYAFLNLKSYKKLLLILYAISSFFIFLLYKTDYLVNGLYEYSWGYYPKAGILHPFYLAFVIITIGSCIFLVFIHWYKKRKETTFYSSRLFYIFIALNLASFACIDFIPNYGISIYPLGWFFVIAYCSIIAYAILRHRLLDIHFVIKKTMVYSLVAGLLTAVFVVLVLSMTTYLTKAIGVTNFWIIVIAALAIAFMFTPLKNKIQSLIDRIFYKTTYDYYATIRKVSHDLASKFNKDDIYSFIVNTVYSTLRLKSAYLLSGENRHFEVSFSKVKKDAPADEGRVQPLKIKRDSELVRILQESSDVIVSEELPKLIEEERSNAISNELLPFQGEIAVPVFIDDKLSHLLILGEKFSGDIFTQEDINLLNTIANQGAIAIKNAALYAENIRAERLASIGKMAATLAHEIKNPLASIKVFTQLIPEKFYDTEFRESFSKIVSSEIDRIDGLVSELLDFSKHTPVQRTMIDARQLLDDIIDLVSAQFDSSSINILKKYDGNFNISGEPGRLKQAILNIFINSQHAMQHGGTIDVELSTSDNYVTIAIGDNGTGIPDEVIDKIFDPFFTTKQRGAGLGLAISKKIIDDHGGRIIVENRKSKGTLFTLFLPIFTDSQDRVTNGNIGAVKQ